MSALKAALAGILSNPKLRRAAVLAGAYAAGAHGGPVAASAVKAYAPIFVDAIAAAIGGR